jgi:hypothetical protein
MRTRREIREMPGTNVPQRVTFLYRGVRLGAEFLALHGEHRHVNVISSPVELVNGPPADVVVIDVPAPDRRAACEQVRRHHRGPLIVLLGQRESGRDLPPDHNRTVLSRPISLRQLSVALAMPAPTVPTWEPAAHPLLVPPPVARAGGPNTSRGAAPRPVTPALPRPARSWRERRLVRVSTMSVMAALLFMGAFAVVSQGNRCGPGCDELAGADLVAPPSTTAPLGVASSDTTGPGAGRVDPTTSDPGAGPTANGDSPVDAAGIGTTPSLATSASSSGEPTPTSAPDPTRPQPTAAPTTAPTTTRPRASTSTSTSTSATTTTTTSTTGTGP